MGGPIDLKQNGCELIGCWTYYVALKSDLTHDPDTEFLDVQVQI